MKILVVVDMQNDFLTGSLANAEGVKIIGGVAQLVKQYKGAGHTVLATRDTHFSDYLTTQEGKSLPVEHCVKDSHGWQIASEIEDALGDCKVFNKPVFGSVELAQYVKELCKGLEEDTEITLVGVCTDICVISNAVLLKAFLPEAVISVRADLCAGVTPGSHQTALAAMSSCQIKII